MDYTIMITQEESQMMIRRFWALLKQLQGYSSATKDNMKEQFVLTHSGGRTTSLSKFIAIDDGAFTDMLIEMDAMIKAEAKETGHATIDAWRRRVMAAVCEHIDLTGQRFNTANEKLDLAASIACRAANEKSLDRISTTKLQAIYNAFLIKNKTLKNNLNL